MDWFFGEDASTVILWGIIEKMKDNEEIVGRAELKLKGAVEAFSYDLRGKPEGSGTSRSRPPAAIHCTRGEVAVGTVVEVSTQELERPCIASGTEVEGGGGGVLL